MLSIRFMYHGQDNSDDYHSATLDVAINWEAPYFRFNKGMSDVREITLEWKTPSELESLLDTELPKLIELFGGMEREAY